MSEIIHCANCAKKMISANPMAFGNSSIQWINLLEQGVSAVCPSCGIIYSVAKVISNSPQIPQDMRNVAATVCGLLLIFAGAIYLDRLLFK